MAKNPNYPVCTNHAALGKQKCDCDPDIVSAACWHAAGPVDTYYGHDKCNGMVSGPSGMQNCTCLCHENDGVWAAGPSEDEVREAIESIARTHTRGSSGARVTRHA